MKKFENLFVKCLIVLITTFVVNMFINLNVRATSNVNYTSLYYYSNNLQNTTDYFSYIKQEAIDYGISQNNIHTFTSGKDNFQELLTAQYPYGITGISDGDCYI